MPEAFYLNLSDGVIATCEEIVSHYVPRVIFDIIVKGVSERFEKIAYHS